MNQIRIKVAYQEGALGQYLIFNCPGCDDRHRVIVGVSNGWTWNGDVVNPTFNPSVLVQYGNHIGAKRCHSFVRDGRIEYLSDCTHVLADKTVELPFWDL